MAPRRSRSASPTQTNFADLLQFEEGADARPAGTVKEQEADALLTHLAPEFVPVFTVKLVRTDSVAWRERVAIRAPRSVATLLAEYLKDADRENFAIVLLDNKGKVIGVCTASVGDLSSALVHPREVFKAAILSNAASIILAHNHPSGDPNPSPEDTAVTRRLMQAGELLGIEVLDHIIIGDGGRWFSLKEKGLCESRAAYSVTRSGSDRDDGFSR